MLKHMLTNTVVCSSSTFKHAASALAFVGLLLGASSASALTLAGPSCFTTSVSGATACSGVQDGNDSNQALDGLFGISEWTEILKLDSSSATETGGGITLNVESGIWDVDTYAGNDPVMFVLKGGPTFSAFLMDTSVLSGTWDTQSMLKGNGDRGAGLSHWTVYSGGTVVPLPAAAWLFGSALLGLAGIGCRRRRLLA